ncbi:MAG TPA: hypothetical protein VEK08_26900 [Planctomycetota bacterium]|nr:hypothetical protein [Planctomycetota bacterium]
MARKASGGRGDAGTRGNCVFEADASQLTLEDQAEIVGAQMGLRGAATKLDGAVKKLRGQMMRPNALLQPHAINMSLDEIEAFLFEARHELRKVPGQRLAS